jgi:hypothetical protein
MSLVVPVVLFTAAAVFAVVSLHYAAADSRPGPDNTPESTIAMDWDPTYDFGLGAG